MSGATVSGARRVEVIYSHVTRSGGRGDVDAVRIPSFPFAPGVHVNYESTVLPMKDGLPKLKDFPAELGGSRETLPECGRTPSGLSDRKSQAEAVARPGWRWLDRFRLDREAAVSS